MNIRCQSCNADLVVEEQLKTAVCPYCASTSIVERPPNPNVPAPGFVLGFSFGEAVARKRVAEWLSGRSIFCQSGVRNASLLSVRGVYLPTYLYSAVARASYRANIGENYTTTESYTTTENGKTVRKTRTVVKTEWRPLSGEFAEYLPDVVVTASRGLPNDELQAVEPFDLRLLSRYSPALLSGWIAEEPTLSLEECQAQARAEANSTVQKRLQQFMPGDSHQDLSFQLSLEHESLDLVLAPVWILAARHHPESPPFRVVLNGQTGQTFGRAPLSWMKIGVAVGVALSCIAAAVLYGMSQGWFR